jgi:hypothetical protein
VKPIRIDFTPSLVPKFSRTVWFAVLSAASVVLSIVTSTTPNGAPLGDHFFNCMSPAERLDCHCEKRRDEAIWRDHHGALPRLLATTIVHNQSVVGISHKKHEKTR